MELLRDASLRNYRKVCSEVGCLEEDIPGGCKINQISEQSEVGGGCGIRGDGRGRELERGRTEERGRRR